MKRVTRRTFFEGAAFLGAASGLQAREEPLPSQADALQVFPYGAVRLTSGPLKRQFDENHEFYLNLSEDRLLKIYRKRAGLPAPGEDMGGWYDGFCPGAHFGQYVSALARFASATGSQPTRAKVGRLVRGYAQTLNDKGTVFADLRYPAYTYDKIVCMLIDADAWAGQRDAASILETTTHVARPHMPEKALTREERLQRPHKDETYTWDETYTLAENLYLAGKHFRNRQYSEMAGKYLLDKTFFNPLAAGENALTGVHAYSHVNALSSGMQGYLNLGDPKYYYAARNAVEMIWKDQSYATGGWGPNETFVKPGRGELAASLDYTHRSFETPCGAYAHFKIMRYLLALTRDPRYGDSMERVLYNTVLGAKRVQEDGSSFYYSDYHDSGFKAKKRDLPESKYPWDHDGRWPCCSGTLPQIAADYTISGYFHDRRGVYVNLYAPSELRWSQGRTSCVLKQDTTYPVDNLVTMHLELSAPTDFSVFLRIPEWAGHNTSVAVNGKRLGAPVQSKSFYEISRSWKSGDKIELEIDQIAGTQAVDAQTPNRVAIVRGPQVLFGIARTPLTMARHQAERPAISKAEGDDWKLSAGEAGDVKLRPFWAIDDEAYQTYWTVRS